MDGLPITVAYDGSADADRALQWGVDLARKQQAPLTVRIPTEDEFDDYLASQWAAEAEALLSFCGLERWSVDLRPYRFDDGSLLVLPTHGIAVELAAHACPYLSGALNGSAAGSFSGDVPPVVTVRGALDETSTRVVVGVRGLGAARRAVQFGCEHADWIGGSVHLVDLAGPVRPEVGSLVGELAATYPHVPVTISATEGGPGLVELSREAILVVVAPDAAPGSAEQLRAAAACSVAVLG